MSANSDQQQSFARAKAQYATIGVDVQAAMEKLKTIPISMHCWQGDDVGGFESPDAALGGGGIQATGNYPGKSRSIDELRMDFEKALSMIPGNHRMNLHAMYLDNGGKNVERDAIGVEHFQGWIDWCKANSLGMDFNPSCFSHPKSDDGFTLSSIDSGIRNFWIDHCIASRKIAAEMGKQLGSPAVTNVWIPDGYKDQPIDRKGPRERLMASLDTVFAETLDPKHNLDAVECKLFGIGSESYVVGSHEFYMGYAISRQKLLCLDAGHFHPTEMISDKLSSILTYVNEILLHVSRPVRWDSDHVIILDDELRSIAQQLVRGDYLDRTHIGLDFFDASINRVAAWVIGVRNMCKALLLALLEPIETFKQIELDGDFTGRLALVEEQKTMPFGAVWYQYCEEMNVPVGSDWLTDIRQYESDVLSKRA
jgi:L-rhamnose isomerase